MATAGTVLLASTPVQAQEGWDIATAPADERADCVPVSTPGESLNEEPWPKRFIGLDQAHEFNQGTFANGDPVIVAVIDSGVAAERDDVFGGRLLPGFDAWDENSLGQCDAYMHGTAVAAIAAGGKLADEFIGVAPEAEILPIRVYLGGDNDKDADSPEKSKLVAQAITAAVAHGADVINISATAIHTEELAAAVADAIAQGTVIVAATGNKTTNMDDKVKVEPDKQTYYPADYPEVIAVGAHDENGIWYGQTNYGKNIDLLAPGVNVGMPYAGGQWFADEGTSYAAPFVAGAAALLKGQFGEDASPAWIQKRLQETAIHPPDGFNVYQGYGILNVANALTAPVEDDPTATDVDAPVTDDASSAAPAPDELGAIPPIDVDYDPLATEKIIAWASVGGALVLIALVLVLRSIVPKGRRRGWRAGTRKPDNLPARTADG